MPDASSIIFLNHDKKNVYRHRRMFPVWGGAGRGGEQSSLPIQATWRTSTLQSHLTFRSDQISRSVVSDSWRHERMNHITPGLRVHHKLPEFTQTHVHRVSDAIQPSHPLSSPSPPAPNPSQHQSLFQ